MTAEFPQWNSVERLNQIIDTPVCNYVLLLTGTESFNIEEDLKKTLHITKRPVNWFVEKFKFYGVRVEYATIFCEKDIRHFGPISQTTSEGICKQYLRSKYPPSVIVVCPPGFAKQLPFESINPETLVQKLIG